MKTEEASELSNAFVSAAQSLTLHSAIKTWGKKAQTVKMQEECLELSLAINHYHSKFKNTDTKAALIDEIADVTILMRQAEIIFGKDAIQKRIDYKMKRLKRTLNKINN